MAYATEQDAVDLYGSNYVLTAVDRDGDGLTDTTALTAALDQATSEIDSYLGVRYELPLATVPTHLKRFTIDVAIYVASADIGTLTEEKHNRYKEAIKWCERVAAGKATLGLAEPAASTQDEQTIQTSFTTRQFTRNKLGGLL